MFNILSNIRNVCTGLKHVLQSITWLHTEEDNMTSDDADANVQTESPSSDMYPNQV